MRVLRCSNNTFFEANILFFRLRYIVVYLDAWRTKEGAKEKEYEMDRDVVMMCME